MRGRESRRTHRCVCVCYKHTRLFRSGRPFAKRMEKRLSTEKKRRSLLLFFTYYHIYPSLFFLNIEKHVSAILYKNEIRVKVFFLFFFSLCGEFRALFSPSNELRGGAAPSLPLRRRSFGPFFPFLNMFFSFSFL